MSLIAGISGIRGIIGQTLTPGVAVAAGAAMAGQVDGGRVVVGRDSRPSGPMVHAGVVSGLLAGGCEVIDVGVVTTPTTAMMVKKLGAAGGIVITASHNPSEWNGIKFLTAEGAAPRATIAEEILRRFRSDDARLVPVEQLQSVGTDTTAQAYHVDTVLRIVDVQRIRARGFRVVLDSGNGAGGPAGRMLLDALGCRLTHIHAEPTGLFAHRPEPIAENLGELCDRTKAEGADIGFAQDPDADRLAIVDERGAYIGEEYTLAIAARHVFGKRPGPACANLATSRMIDELANRAGDGCVVHRSAVGEANVVEMMVARGCVIGGEGNGGVIDPRVVLVRDSLTAMALALQVLAEEERTVSQVVADIPPQAMVKVKFDCERDRVGRVIAAVKQAFAGERMSTVDGVRIDWPEGWVLIRGSNTEPIMRVIAEAADAETAGNLIGRVRKIADATR